MKTIVIDPGHGEWDSGATAVDGLAEKHFNLELGLALRAALAAYDCQVIMTRETDTALAQPGQLGAELQARADVANRAGADLLISLHHDWHSSVDARGGSLWIWTDKQGWLPADGNHKAPRSYAIAERAYPHIRDGLAGLGVPWRGSIWCSNFGILRNTNGPAVLLECFMGSNTEDVAAARQPDFIPELVVSIAAGLADALELPRAPEPPPEWDPAAEIEALIQAGLINTRHDPNATVTWGELATVLNRLLNRMGQ